jgi:O-antigen ligase
MENVPMTGMERIQGASRIRIEKTFSFPVFLIMVYILAEYAKPEFLNIIRPALLSQVILLVLLVFRMDHVLRVIRDRYFILFGILLLEMAIHVPIASNNYWALMQLLLMCSYFVITLSMCVFLDTKEKIFTVLLFFIAVHLVVGLEQAILGYRSFFGVHGVLGDTNDVAAGMNVMLPVAIFLGMSCRGFKRAFFWAAALVFILANVSSASRGGFVGLIAVGVFIWWKMPNKGKTLVIILGAILIIAPIVPASYKSEIKSIVQEGTEEGTGRQRIELWKVAWATFKAHPVIGVGQGNLPWVYEKYQDWDNGYWQRGVGGKSVHSIYFTMLPELGLIGLVIYGMMFYNIYKKYLIYTKKASNYDIIYGIDDNMQYYIHGLFGGIIGYYVSGIFLSTFYYPQFFNIAGIVTTIYLNDKRIHS